MSKDRSDLQRDRQPMSKYSILREMGFTVPFVAVLQESLVARCS